jgi:hypothetical protein
MDAVDLHCPSCRRAVVVDSVARIPAHASHSTRCPYPSCSAVIATVVHWAQASTLLFTLPEIARLSRRRLVTQAPAFVVVEALLVLTIAYGAYVLHHLAAMPDAATVVQRLARTGIALGACSLMIPAIYLVPLLLARFVRRVVEHRRTLERLARASTTNGLRLKADPQAYR